MQISGIMLAAYFAAHMQQHKINTGEFEVTAVKDGLCYQGKLYVWDGIINRLEAVFIHPQDTHKLMIMYRQLRGRFHFKGRYVLEIPIPDGIEAAVEDFVKEIGLEADQSKLGFVRAMKNEE